MTTDQLRERVARVIYANLHHLMSVSGMQAQNAYEQTAKSVLALLSPSPRGDEGDLAYVASDGAAVSEKDRHPDLDHLRALSEAATPGPWNVSPPGFFGPAGIIEMQGERGHNGIGIGQFYASNPGGRDNDAAFVVAAVNHVRALLAAAPVPGVLLGDTGADATQRYDPPLPAGTGLDRAGEG